MSFDWFVRDETCFSFVWIKSLSCCVLSNLLNEKEHSAPPGVDLCYYSCVSKVWCAECAKVLMLWVMCIYAVLFLICMVLLIFEAKVRFEVGVFLPAIWQDR